ncbi:MAG: nucleotidyl transferase AbiEii/AbiGii toxin family protein [Polyangiaceae bacterium]
MTGNTAASVRARLTNRAKASHRPFQEVLQHYAHERLLYRLAQSPYRDRFLLKGALLLNAWNAPVSRPTRDIDLLCYAKNDVAVIEAMFRDVCELAVVNDGLRFDASTLVGFVRLNKVFDGKLEGLLGELADEGWSDAG